MKKNNIKEINQSIDEITMTKIDFSEVLKKDCELDKIPIKQLYEEKNNKFFLPSSKIKEKSGIYIFWWKGDINIFEGIKYILKGPAGIEKRILINKNWIENATFENAICLYVGKSTAIHQRIGKHIKIENNKTLFKENDSKTKKSNTESQLRNGLERLFPKERNSLKLILDNVSISILGEESAKNAIDRFYLEDYLIGKFKPLLNLDIER